MPPRTHQRSLWQVLGLYAAGSWVCLQVVDVLGQNIPLPSWVFVLTLALLAAGLPVVAATAYFQGIGRKTGDGTGADAGQHPREGAHGLFTWGNVLRAAVAALALWGVVVTGWLALGRNEGPEWDAVAGVEELGRLAGERDFAGAFALAERMDGIVRNDSVRAAMWAAVSRPVTLSTDPPGARVLRRFYSGTDTSWQDMGRTPLSVERFPFGLHRIRFELEGHLPRQTVAYSGDLARAGTFRLDTPETLPEGMIRVAGGWAALWAPGLEQLDSLRLGDYLMDVHEVTNRQYKAFVEAGGYAERSCWTHPFVRDGDTISFGEAMEAFVDRTGRPGPSTWEVGSYPDGADDLPVGGVSWYEAEAYACSVGKALPTVYHWYREADPFSSNFVVPESNFGGEGPAPVGQYGGVSQDGAFDMAGNVREWTRNAVGENRFILGGGWDDLEYAFNDAVTSPALDRSPANGIRLVEYPDSTNLAAASADIVPEFRDYRAELPVPDEVFEAYRQMYAYDATPLNARVVRSDTTAAWIREQVELDAAYGGERLTLFLFLPRSGSGPFQTIAFFPGSDDIYKRSFDELGIAGFDFIVRSGRALVYPVYKGTYTRGGDLESDIQDESNLYRDHVIAWSKDLGRALDYAATRPDLDSGRLGYFGVSWGSAMAPVMTAIERRFGASVLVASGLTMQSTQPMVDPFDFLPRVTVPTLMINARYDSFFPVETSQKPFFDNLGTAGRGQEARRHRVQPLRAVLRARPGRAGDAGLVRPVPGAGAVGRDDRPCRHAEPATASGRSSAPTRRTRPPRRGRCPRARPAPRGRLLRA